MIELRIVVASTRPVRLGPVVADWVRSHVPSDRFTVETVDLRELALPLLDEPEMASTGDYRQAHTRRWKAVVDGADALVVVTPEYNDGYPASLKNAIDYLYAEWEGMPVAVVGYGYRAAASCREQLATVLRRVRATVVDSVGLRFADHLVGEPGPSARVDADAELVAAVRRLFADLERAVGERTRHT